MSETRVTDLTSRSTMDGLEVQITITRDWRVHHGAYPNVTDVPGDVLAALREWLDGAR